MSKTYSDLSCGAFVEALASAAPTPGGGGASALCGALGAALGAMVCNLTLGKEKYAAVAGEAARILACARQLQSELLELIDGDAAAFEPLARAYGLPKDTEQARAHRQTVMEAALQTAAQAPLAIMARCCEAIALLETLVTIGAPIAVSDVGCAAACCRAALTGAALNVWINTKSMTDRANAAALNARAQAMLDECIPRCEQVYEQVARQLERQ